MSVEFFGSESRVCQNGRIDDKSFTVWNDTEIVFDVPDYDGNEIQFTITLEDMRKIVAFTDAFMRHASNSPD